MKRIQILLAVVFIVIAHHSPLFAGIKLGNHMKLIYDILDKNGEVVGTYEIQLNSVKGGKPEELVSHCNFRKFINSKEVPPFCAVDESQNELKKRVTVDPFLGLKVLDIMSLGGAFYQKYTISFDKKKGAINIKKNSRTGGIEMVVPEALKIRTMDLLMLSSVPANKPFFWLEERRSKRLVLDRREQENEEWKGLGCSLIKESYSRESALSGKRKRQFSIVRTLHGVALSCSPVSGRWKLRLKGMFKPHLERIDVTRFIRGREADFVRWLVDKFSLSPFSPRAEFSVSKGLTVTLREILPPEQ